MHLCNRCKKEYDCKDRFDKHLKSNKCKEPYECKACEYITKRKSDYTKHIQTKKCKDNTLKLESKKYKYICKDCNKSFRDNYVLSRHLNRKNPCNYMSIDHHKNISNSNFNSRLKINSVNDILTMFAKLDISTLEVIDNKDEKAGYVYICTNVIYQNNNIFKIGRTKNLKSRLISFNTDRIDGDKMYYCLSYKCKDCHLFEKLVFNCLYRYKLSGEKYQIPFNLLKSIIDQLYSSIEEQLQIIDNITGMFKNDINVL